MNMLSQQKEFVLTYLQQESIKNLFFLALLEYLWFYQNKTKQQQKNEW